VKQTSLLTMEGRRGELASRRGHVGAVERLDLAVEPGESLGVVGESGAGKSTIGNAVIGLLEPPGEMTAGTILLKGDRIDDLDDAGKRKIRGNRIGMIFQEPMTSLNPVFTVGDQINEAAQLPHNAAPSPRRRDRAIEMLRRVHIPNPEKRIDEYPHQISGGMRQRVMIAMALCCEPDILIADEPTSALDPELVSEVLAVMRNLAEEGRTMLIVTHEMGFARDVSTSTMFLHQGKVEEQGPPEKIFTNPDTERVRQFMASHVH